MHRTQIQLTEDQARRLRTLARRDGVSVAEVIRRCVNRVLDQESVSRAEKYQRAAGLVGQLTDPSGETDVATHHDEYLDEAYR